MIPEFNLYEEFWKIYTKQDMIEPQFIDSTAHILKTIIGAGAVIEGDVSGSVFGAGVIVEEGAVVRDSIIMKNTVIHKGAYIEKSIIAENCEVGAYTKIGVGEEAESKLNSSIYAFGLATIGEKTIIPANVTIGKNTAIRGVTEQSDYPQGELVSGGYIIKAGEEA